jgi:uncharacterized protein YjiS (DUF1127 family)
MSTLTQSTLVRDVPRLADRLKALLRSVGDVFAGIDEAREMAARYERLSRMSNSELARIGLKREDIPQAVISGRHDR